MVRSLVIDRAVEAHAQGCKRLGVQAEVGFIVGRPQANGAGDILLKLIPTPASDHGAAVQLDGPGHVTLDLDWIIEHGCQLAKMLVGGIRVLGCYIVVSSKLFGSCSSTVARLVKEVQEEVPGRCATLLLHIDPTNGSMTVKDAAGDGGLKPCDPSVTDAASQFVQLSTRYVVDVGLSDAGAVPQYRAARRAVLDDVAARLDGAVLSTVSGKILGDAAVLGEAAPIEDLVGPQEGEGHASGQPATDGSTAPREPVASETLPHTARWTVALHGPVVDVLQGSASRLRGVVDARACVSKLGSVAAARTALLEDVRDGIAARLAVEEENEEGQSAGAKNDAADEEGATELLLRRRDGPLVTLRRVFLSLPDSPLSFADTLGSQERPELALTRFQEVLGGAVVAEMLALDVPLEVARYTPGQQKRRAKNEKELARVVTFILVACLVLLYFFLFHFRK